MGSIGFITQYASYCQDRGSPHGVTTSFTPYIICVCSDILLEQSTKGNAKASPKKAAAFKTAAKAAAKVKKE